MTSKNDGSGIHGLRGAIATVLLTTSALTGILVLAPVAAQAQTARDYDIEAGPLASVLNRLAEQADIKLFYDSSLTNGIASTGLKGRHGDAEALTQLLAGTGLTYRQTGPRAFTLERAPQVHAGTIRLGTLRVQGVTDGASGPDNGRAASWDGSASKVYTTPGSVSVITRETLEAHPGTSPADMLKSVTGVLSGESRNSGSLDVNIRGLQGQGRVPVTVDGSLNGTTVYRGYQGTSNRTFIDPDFISHVAIEKGPSTGNAIAGGIGGSVSMTTLNADDIVPEGSTMGLRFKVSLSNNSTEPGSPEDRNLLEPSSSGGNTLAIMRGVNRPGFLQATGGSGSLTFARKSDWLDLVAGYAFRRSGNYHAGTKGKGAPDRADGPSPFCAANPDPLNSAQLVYICKNAVAFYESSGTTPFVGGEEVLNTSSRTESVLAKAVIRPADDHSLELGYGGYWSRFGENYPTEVFGGAASVREHHARSTTSLDRFTARYRWNPDNALIDLKANAWLTKLRETSAAFIFTEKTRRYVDTIGGDISNASRLATPVGLLAADYGVSYLSEETGPFGKWPGLGQGTPGREGKREEISLFTQVRLEPVEWLRFDGGMRYQKYWLKDRQSGATNYSSLLSRNEDAYSFSLGAAVMPLDGLQLFASYKQASRLPSLMEATSGFFMIVNPDLRGEEAHNREMGANFSRKSVLSDADELGVKLAWFDNDTQNYIARRYIRSRFAMQMYNIDRAQFRGLEASMNYRIGGFSVQAGITWYNRVAFCRPDEACISSSLASDYATNYIPPKFAATLAVNQKFLNDRFNLGMLAVYRGKRASSFEPTDNGYAPLISAITWDPFVTLDLTGGVKMTEGLSIDWSVENATDRFYVDPLNLGVIPSPGRTFRIGLTGQLGAAGKAWPGNWFGAQGNADPVDWTGPYAGVTLGYGLGREKGTIHDKEGTVADGGIIDQKLNNFAVGFHAGINWQLPSNIVLGVEGDIMTGGFGSTASVAVNAPEGTYLLTQGRSESSVDYRWDRFSTLRGRLGYSLGNSLLYTTGGAAFLRETQTRSQYRTNAENNQAYGSSMQFMFEEKERLNRTGWTLGGGIERALGRHLSLRAEYSYADFGKKTATFDRARAGAGRTITVQDIIGYGPPTVFEFPGMDPLIFENPIYQNRTVTGTSEIANGRRASSRTDMHSLRLGLTYRF